MKRRDFVKTAALAGTALAAGPQRAVKARPAGAPVDRPGLKKALKLHMIEEGETVQEKFALAKQIGFDGIELRSPNDLDREAVLQAREETGLPIHGVVDSVHWDQPLSSPDPAVRAEGIKGLRAALADAQAYGASTVLLVPAIVTEEVAYDDAWQRSRDAIRKVLPEAEERDVKIAIENVWNHFLLSPMEMARYVDEFESAHMGVYFDIGNIANYGWPDQWMRILGDRTLKLDVKGYSRQKRDAEGPRAGFVNIGAGDINWEAVQAAQADVGYTGWATAEVSGGGRERLQEIARNMDRVLAIS